MVSNNDSWQLIQKKLGVQFKDSNLLIQAFASHDSKGKHDRLEYLGDAVLFLCVKSYLFSNFVDSEEAMTLWASALTCNDTLKEVANELDITQYLYSSSGTSRLYNKKAADLIEAIIGAIYIDQGYLAASTFITRFILIKAHEVTSGTMLFNPTRTLIAELKKTGGKPEFREINRSGTAESPQITIGVYSKGRQLGLGCGTNLNQARKIAAAKAAQLGTQLHTSVTFRNLSPSLQQQIIAEASKA